MDTAGRLHIDESMMQESKVCIKRSILLKRFFVVDSMTGQDAANTAKAFHDALPLTGVILTKIDGERTRRVRPFDSQITGKPIKFIGVGEKNRCFRTLLS